MEKFFGGSPLGVLLRLVVLSIVVGIVFATLNIDATVILRGITNLAQKIYDLGFDSIEWLLQYFVLGAVIVFPIWFIARLFKTGSKSEK